MKYITIQHYRSVVDSIIKDKQKEAESHGRVFDGISGGELNRELDRHFVGDWAVKSEQSVKFSKADINSVASGRFYRATGRSLLMGLLIILLALAVVVKYIPNMTAIWFYAYYAACGVSALVILYIYAKKQRRVRKELWHELGRNEEEEQ